MTKYNNLFYFISFVVLWCITIAQSYDRHPKLTGSLWPFIVTDITTGLVSPILIIFSIIPITRIVRYVSHNRLETRKILLWFLPFLGYEKGSKGVYWVLEDSFYYKVHNGFCGSLSTALIYTTAGLTFLFSWVYFIDDVFVKKTGLSSCMQLNQIEKETTYCFHIHPTDLNLYVNCTANNSYNDHLFCFEFKETGRNANIIQSLVISIILYYISVICISLTFQIMKCLQRYAHSYLWSTFVVMVGFFICLIGVVHFVSALYFRYYLNVLTLFQIFIISANIIVIGILIAGGQLMQNQQSFSENTSILLNYRVNGDSFTGPNQADDAEFVHVPDNIPVHQTIEDNTSADIPHPIDQTNPQDTPLTPISDGTPPAILPPPSPSNSLPPPSSTPPPPLTSSPSSLQTSSTITTITKPSITTSDSLVTNKTNGGNVMQQITDVSNNHMVHAATNKVMIPRTVYVRNPQSLLQMHRTVMSDAGSGAAMPYIPVSPNYVVLADQRTDRAIRVPTVQYTTIPSQAVVPMQVFVPNDQSSVNGPSSVTELPPKRITIV